MSPGHPKKPTPQVTGASGETQEATVNPGNSSLDLQKGEKRYSGNYHQENQLWISGQILKQIFKPMAPLAFGN